MFLYYTIDKDSYKTQWLLSQTISVDCETIRFFLTRLVG